MGHNRRKQRRSIRLPAYDYTQEGVYFVTICTQDRVCRFGDIADGVMQANAAGIMAEEQWVGLARRFSGLTACEIVVMPNHIHGIIEIHDDVRAPVGDARDVGAPLVGARDVGVPLVGARDVGPPVVDAHVPNRGSSSPIAVGRIIGAFKSCSTNAYIRGVKESGWVPFRSRLWQRNYYEHVVRDDRSLRRIRQYMQDNPLQWSLDRDNRRSRLDRPGSW